MNSEKNADQRHSGKTAGNYDYAKQVCISRWPEELENPSKAQRQKKAHPIYDQTEE